MQIYALFMKLTIVIYGGFLNMKITANMGEKSSIKLRFILIK
jgi:hypothetical protein